MEGLSLTVLPVLLAICRFSSETPLEEIPKEGVFWSATRTTEELSLVIPEDQVQKGWQVERGWRCLKVLGKFDFEVTGVLSALSATLAFAGISIFVVSTFDTDHILVRDEDLDRACKVLTANGHQVKKA